MSCKVNFHSVRSTLQNLICLLAIFADQVFIDPTFFGIFVCGPLQSFVVIRTPCWYLTIRRSLISRFWRLYAIKDPGGGLPYETDGDARRLA